MNGQADVGPRTGGLEIDIFMDAHALQAGEGPRRDP
jgi:hypothetical protein